jgi:hypothetical protein
VALARRLAGIMHRIWIGNIKELVESFLDLVVSVESLLILRVLQGTYRHLQASDLLENWSMGVGGDAD